MHRIDLLKDYLDNSGHDPGPARGEPWSDLDGKWQDKAHQHTLDMWERKSQKAWRDIPPEKDRGEGVCFELYTWVQLRQWELTCKARVVEGDILENLIEQAEQNNPYQPGFECTCEVYWYPQGPRGEDNCPWCQGTGRIQENLQEEGLIPHLVGQARAPGMLEIRTRP
jgi:hypothetical protein